MKRLVVLLAISLFLIGFSAAVGNSTANVAGTAAEASNVGLANPASVYCADMGYQSEMREDASGQYGVCVFPDNNSCEEWSFFRGECGQSYVKTIACRKAGECVSDNEVCCGNLTTIASIGIHDNACEGDFSICDGGSMCSNCGDGICSGSENNCNCPQDCNKTNEKNLPSLVNIHEPFCGTSSLGSCQTDSDCVAGGCSGQVCQSKNEESSVTPCIYRSCFASSLYKVNCSCIENKCRWSVLTEAQIKNITSVGNRIRPAVTIGCPDSCTCIGSSVKCTLADGRIMIIFAGNSGNVIIQVKGENMTTNVTLYKADGNLFGVFRNNETREIKMLPDQVKERVREKLDRDFEDENISLDDNGTYQYTADKPAKLFFIIPIKVPVEANVDSATGNITSIKIGKWWSFLAKDVSAPPIVGYSCGTVTPGQNNACCQTKGFDVWDNVTNQCEFAAAV